MTTITRSHHHNGPSHVSVTDCGGHLHASLHWYGQLDSQNEEASATWLRDYIEKSEKPVIIDTPERSYLTCPGTQSGFLPLRQRRRRGGRGGAQRYQYTYAGRPWCDSSKHFNNNLSLPPIAAGPGLQAGTPLPNSFSKPDELPGGRSESASNNFALTPRATGKKRK